MKKISTLRKIKFLMVKQKRKKSITLQAENMLKEERKRCIIVPEITILYLKIFAYFCS